MREDLELRVVVPADALPGPAPRAECFSQKNCELLLGIPHRQFLDLLRRDDAPPVTPLGKLRLVEREPMLAFLRALRRRAVEPETEERDAGDDVLAEIGCLPARRTG